MSYLLGHGKRYLLRRNVFVQNVDSVSILAQRPCKRKGRLLFLRKIFPKNRQGPRPRWRTGAYAQEWRSYRRDAAGAGSQQKPMVRGFTSPSGGTMHSSDSLPLSALAPKLWGTLAGTWTQAPGWSS